MIRYQSIVLHHSLTKDGKTVNTQAIRRYHKSWAYRGKIVTFEEAKALTSEGKRVKRPWVDVGYHWLIELVNDEYEIFVGRMVTQIGAHVRGHNKGSLGVCIIGNYDIEPPPERLIVRSLRFIRSIMVVHDITVSGVLGHTELNIHKTCPGKRFDLDSFRNRLR